MKELIKYPGQPLQVADKKMDYPTPIGTYWRSSRGNWIVKKKDTEHNRFNQWESVSVLPAEIQVEALLLS
jgi:hypothetical protein